MQKYCLKCNTILDNSDDSVKFCPNCGGTEFGVVNTQETTQPDYTNQETTVLPPQQEVYDNTNYQNPDYSQPSYDGTGYQATDFTQEPKKKMKLSKVLLFVVLPIVLVIAIVFNLSSISGFFIKTFGSDASYMKYVETKAITEYSTTLSDMYNSMIMENLDFNQASDSEIKLTVSEDAEELLGDISGTSMDLAWLNELKLNLKSNINAGKQSYELGLNVSDQDILSLGAILDPSAGDIFVSFGKLTDQVLGIEFDKDDMNLDNPVAELMLEDSDKFSKLLKDALPDSKVLDKLAVKYLKVAIDNIEDVESEKETVEINDIKEKLTVLELEVNQQLLLDMVADILAEAKEDKDIKKILENIEKTAIKNDLIDDELELYDTFVDGVEDLLDNVEDADASDDELFTIFDYVNGSNEVVGREIKVRDEAVAKYVTVKKGSKFAFEADIASQVKIEGEGTDKSNKITGTYSISVSDQELGTIELENFNTKELKKGNLNGTIRFAPDSNLFKQMGIEDSASTVLSMVNPVFEISCKSSDKKAEFALNILNGDEVFVGISCNTKISGSKKVGDVADDKVVEIDDTDAVEDLVKNIDFDSVMEKLKKTNIPEEILDSIDDLLDNIA